MSFVTELSTCSWSFLCVTPLRKCTCYISSPASIAARYVPPFLNFCECLPFDWFQNGANLLSYAFERCKRGYYFSWRYGRTSSCSFTSYTGFLKNNFQNCSQTTFVFSYCCIILPIVALTLCRSCWGINAFCHFFKNSPLWTHTRLLPAVIGMV